jgi:cytochrome P450
MSRAVEDLRILVDQTSRPDPYPVLHRLRAAGPFVTEDGVVPLGRYRDCWEVLRDPNFSSEREQARQAPNRRGPRTRNFLHLDPPDHTRLRRLVTKAFSPRVVQAMETSIRDIAGALFDAAAGRGRMDVIADLAYPLPVRVICDLLGVPFEDHELFLSWSSKLSEALEPPLPGLLTTKVTGEAARARAGFVDYFRALIDRRRTDSGDDLITQLLRVEEDGDQLSESELLSTCVLLINAGHETTVNLIGNGVLALLRHPGQLAALRAEPSLAGAAVEEVLRYDAPVQLVTRIAREPTRMGGIDVAAGDLLLALIGAANRDPDVFYAPDRFDIRRVPGAPTLSFSAGPHFCLGASLARLEVSVAFEFFATRVIAPRLGAGDVEYKPNLNLRGPRRLDLEFDDVRTPAAQSI